MSKLGRAATARVYEIVADLARADAIEVAQWITEVLHEHRIESIEDVKFLLDGFFTDAEIEREVALIVALADADQAKRAMIEDAHAAHGKTIRKLASGRYVREVSWRGESGEEHDAKDEARADVSDGGPCFAKITRIRRAS